MTLLEWSQALELGVDLIDEQHKTLLDTMNALNEQILGGKGKVGCATALRRMQEYIETHFSDEEALMLKSQYPRVDTHVKLHRNFVRETDKFSASDCESDPQKAMEVLGFLQEWLVDHILGPDLVFASHYKGWKENHG